MQPLWPEISIDVPVMLPIVMRKYYTHKLLEFCHKYFLGDPEYEISSTQKGGGIFYTVTVAGVAYTGAIRLDLAEAKESAAEAAVQRFAVIISES